MATSNPWSPRTVITRRSKPKRAKRPAAVEPIIARTAEEIAALALQAEARRRNAVAQQSVDYTWRARLGRHWRRWFTNHPPPGPHQGAREIARRRAAILAGRLVPTPWPPGSMPTALPAQADRPPRHPPGECSDARLPG